MIGVSLPPAVVCGRAFVAMCVSAGATDFNARSLCPHVQPGLQSTVRRGVTRDSVQVEYKPDFRQDIAATWPASIDDSRAAADWAWRPRFDLESMTDDMLAALLRKYQTSIPERGGCIVQPAPQSKIVAAA